ncbi:hypothetical protein [Amphritea balenae]|uniref:hypothetical protein n=1 Tax=Amphritea balenae TaxID=452629 RepID=UPI001475DEB9|nr:hypothetical protein [Amphritea balenae]GGK78313.1 hypothetical protein GCM10007941_30560 [Amphritea balenae]
MNTERSKKRVISIYVLILIVYLVFEYTPLKYELSWMMHSLMNALPFIDYDVGL